MPWRAVSSVSEASGDGTGERDESKEPGMGWERGVGKMSGRGVEELATSEEEAGLTGLFANLPVIGSLYSLLMERVA